MEMSESRRNEIGYLMFRHDLSEKDILLLGAKHMIDRAARRTGVPADEIKEFLGNIYQKMSEGGSR